MNLIERIDVLLPQTQCGKCGHPGCRPYAEGIANGEAINKCPPGSDETVAALAQLLNLPAIPLDTTRGTSPAQVAFIREAECIGCTKCIQACPIDAIVGAAKLMHTVIVDECTGCDLCVAPCPVDCIDLLPLPSPTIVPVVGGLAFDEAQRVARVAKRGHARHRYQSRNLRLQREEQQRQAERLARQPQVKASVPDEVDSVQAALDRVRTQKAVNGEAALKQARAGVSMSRAQLNKSLKAFGHPPIAEQAAQLVVLQREFEEAERALSMLQNAEPASSPSCEPPSTAPRTEQVDKAAQNRAKIQLAMRRAALKKAQAANAPVEQLALLETEIAQAERELQAVRPT